MSMLCSTSIKALSRHQPPDFVEPDFVDSIKTGNETGGFKYNPETKSQSAE